MPSTPAVSALQRRGPRRRVAEILLAALPALAGLLALLVPPLIRQITGLVAAVPATSTR
jgi:predicted PurR-regulated permease PerM